MPSSSSPAGGALAPPLPLPSSVAIVGEVSMDARSSELEANNKKTTTIHKDFLLARTEGQPCENISSGSDCDDIIILKRKLKSLKRKYVDLRESVENAKKSSAVVIGSTNHGAVGSLFKSILENHTHSPDFDMVRNEVVSALDHFHEENSTRFTSSVQDLANVFVKLIPIKRRMDPKASPTKDEANTKEGENISNHNNVKCCQSKSEIQSDEATVKVTSSGSHRASPSIDERATQKISSSTGSGTSNPRWDRTPVYDKSQSELHATPPCGECPIQEPQGKQGQAESPTNLQEFIVECTQRKNFTHMDPVAPLPIGNPLQSESNNSPDIQFIRHYIPNNLATLEVPSFSLGLDELDSEDQHDQTPHTPNLENYRKEVPQDGSYHPTKSTCKEQTLCLEAMTHAQNNLIETTIHGANDGLEVLMAPSSLFKETHCINTLHQVQKVAQTPSPVPSANKELIDLVTPEAVLSSGSFDRKCIDICIEAERLYNQRRSTGDNVNFVRNLTSAEVGPFYLTPTRALQPLDTNVIHDANNTGTTGSSTCKMAAYGKRRQVVGSKFTTYPYVKGRNQFCVSKVDKAYYDGVLSISSGPHSGLKAVRLNPQEFPHIKFSCLGHSLKPDGKVKNFVINSFCRLLFLDHHPSKSLKHHFFSTVGGYFLSSEKDFKFVQVEHEFRAAHGVRSLQSSELIQFPIIHEDHWFLFIVNIKDRKFVFIDSLHTEGHSYHKSIKARIIRNFISSFSQCAKRSTINFAKFDIEYQRPHQQTSDKDSGVYVMMYMKNYGPRIALETVFNVEDIPNIRIIIMNQLLRSKHNLEDLSLLHSIIAKGPKVC